MDMDELKHSIIEIKEMVNELIDLVKRYDVKPSSPGFYCAKCRISYLSNSFMERLKKTPAICQCGGQIFPKI